MGQFGKTMGELMLEDAIKRARLQSIRRLIYSICAVILIVAAIKYILN